MSKFRGKVCLSVILATSVMITSSLPSMAWTGEDVSGNQETIIENSNINDDISEDISENDISDNENYDLVETNENLFTWNGTVITGYTGTATEIVIPAKTTEIGNKAFENSNVKIVKFKGNKVTKIGEYAFYNSQLEEISLPESLKIIKQYSFDGTALTEIVIPQNVERIGSYAFIAKLTSVIIKGNCLRTIEEKAFYGQKFTSIEFPESLQYIGDEAFSNCGLTSLQLTRNISYLGNRCFELCKLEQLTIDSTKIVSNNDSFHWTYIRKLTITPNVISLGNNMFEYALFLSNAEIVLPETLTKIGDSIFTFSYGLSKVDIECNIDSLPVNVFEGSKLKSLKIGNHITSIGDYAFRNCLELTEIEFSNNLTVIGNYAFEDCEKLEEVYLPNGMSNIGNQAFAQCFELSTVYIPSTVTTIGEDAFINDAAGLVLYVVENSYAHEWAETNGYNYKFYDDGRGTQISVKYNLNGGQNNPENAASYCKGEEVTFCNPTKTGYTFAGWYYESSYTNKIPATITVDKNLQIYAKWTPIVYTITYNLNGAKSNSNPETYTIETNTISLKAPILEAGTFLGWYDHEGRKITTIPKGTSGNLELTAKWNEFEYTIVFAPNGASGYMKAMTLYYSAEKQLSELTYAKKGYYFKGWNTKADGKGTGYYNCETVSKLCNKKNGTITLYAQWGLETYDIVYSLNGGTQNSKNKTTYNMNTAVSIYAPTRTGFTFLGWYKNADLSGAKVSSLAKGSVGDIYLYAKWSENSYKILYSLNGSNVVGTVANANPTYAEDVVLPDTSDISRAGYTLIGWNTKANGSGTAYDPGTSVSELTATDRASVTLYAQWQADEYDICYYNVDDADNTKNTSTYNTTQKITLKNPVRTGYTFKGWYDNEELSGSRIAAIKKGSTGDKDLYASWQENSYKLVFHKNSGTLTATLPAAETYAYTDDVTLPDEILSRTSYWLSGWNTKSNGQGIHYDLGDTVSGIGTQNGKTITLYAEWTPIHYDLFYELDGGENNAANPDYHTAVATLTLKNPTKVGYTFKGWYTSSDVKASGKISKVAKSDQPVTVYAKWQANTYKISFNKNGGSGTMSTITMTYDTAKTLPSNKFTKSGKTFAGWNTKPNGSGDSYTDAETVSNLTATNGKVVTLYAMWKNAGLLPKDMQISNKDGYDYLKTLVSNTSLYIIGDEALQNNDHYQLDIVKSQTENTEFLNSDKELFLPMINYSASKEEYRFEVGYAIKIPTSLGADFCPQTVKLIGNNNNSVILNCSTYQGGNYAKIWAYSTDIGSYGCKTLYETQMQLEEILKNSDSIQLYIDLKGEDDYERTLTSAEFSSLKEVSSIAVSMLKNGYLYE